METVIKQQSSADENQRGFYLPEEKEARLYASKNQKGKKKSAGSMEGEEMRQGCLLYTSPSPRDLSTSRMPSSA